MRKHTVTRTLVCFTGLVVAAAVAQADLPVKITASKTRNNWAAIKLLTKAEDQLKNDDIAGAKESVEAALRIDPTLWPALYTRARVRMHEGKYELAVRDAGEALRQYPPFVEAALLRAAANEQLGRYAEALKEINHCISIHPRRDAMGRALRERAWLEAGCPDPTFRNGQQAIKDATNACKLLLWQDEQSIAALAAAYAEVGDFDSAVRYAEQALATKGTSPAAAKGIQHDLALFKQHRPIRLR
ncbi:MAG: tetratricopeptide repeat protein [Chthoniobacterales bacterium]